MTTAEILLAQILERPEQDDLRLIFADWLEEHGEAERAEFVRVQVQLAEDTHDSALCNMTGVCGRCSRSLELQRRERELLRTHQGRWTVDALDQIPLSRRTPLLQLAAHDATRTAGETGWPRDDSMFQFRRGFLAHVTCALDDWLAHGPRIVRVQPVERVRISDREPYRIQRQADKTVWTWWPNTAYRDLEDDRSNLPPELLRVLLALAGQERFSRSFHDSPEVAHEALSVACLKWAKGDQPAAKINVPATSSVLPSLDPHRPVST